jgi:hypothetical protein
VTIPYINGMLTAITPKGATADYDQAPADGTPRWTGSLGIYVAEETLEELASVTARAVASDRLDEILRTRVEIPHTVGQLVERGDTLTYTYEGEDVRRVAGTITHAPLVGRVRVLLEDA